MAINGVPALLNKFNSVTNVITLLAADAANVLGLFPSPVWGIFDANNKLVIQPDSIVAFDFKREWRLPDYPMEQGAFQAYNKVATPFDARIKMTKGGTDDDRLQFLQNLDDAASSLNTYTILTPSKAFLNVNIHHYDYRRTAKNGLTLLTVDVWLTQIRFDAVAQSASTKYVSGADAKSAGNVQPQAATAAQKSTSATVQ